MLLPTPSLRGLVDYFALASGIVIGFAILSGPMQNLTDTLRKN